ncbi:hypothetical protein Q5P01_005839 [Channa striata]|uniref:Uncharacterized protein n=1 Tax=Channa striata TaxID=64152 RepID=A0AA88NEB8_CHASR|nr:hypothetical protein Q5P01_005839 [Channa striata]
MLADKQKKKKMSYVVFCSEFQPIRHSDEAESGSRHRRLSLVPAKLESRLFVSYRFLQFNGLLTFWIEPRYHE